MTRSISTLVALAMVLSPACNKDDAPAATAAATPPAPTKAGDGKTPDGKTPTPATTATTPTTPVTPRPPEVIPPMPAIEPLLDLVPASADFFIVSRAPLDFVDGVGGIVLGGKTAWSRALDAVADPARPGADAGMRKVLDEFDVIRTTLTTTGLHLEKGVVINGMSDGASKTVLVVAADDVETVPKILLTFDPTPEGDPMRCKALPEHAGWVACASNAAALADYSAGGNGTTLASELAGALGSGALASLNVAAKFADKEDGPFTLAVHTHDGVLQTDIAAPALAAYADVDAPGPALALGTVAPGGSFMWARYDIDAALRKSKTEVPAMASGMVRALSGEVLVSSVGSLPGLALLVGLTDPTPVAGLIPMAGLAKDKVPKVLPDGSKLSFAIEDADDGAGGKVQVLRLTVDPVGELAAIRDQLGWKSEVVAFVTKEFFAIGVGSSTALVPEVVKASTTGASEATLAALPARLAADLGAGQASLVMHVELDGLHGPGVREAFATALAKLPAGAVPADVALDAAYAAMSPLSSVSIWTSSGGSGVVVHMAMRAFGDTSSDEGKAAATARVDVTTAKRDAATAYGELVTAYPSSSRMAAYRARAGQGEKSGAAGIAAVVGVLSGVAIPAFTRYIEKSETKAVPPTVAPTPAPAP